MIPRGVPFLCMLCCLVGVASQCTKRIDDTKCHIVVADTVGVQADNCSIVSCDANPSFHIDDDRRGQVTLELPAVLPQCNFTRYEIALRLYVGSAADTPTGCPNQDSDWRTHSRRNIKIVYCAKTNSSCIAESPACKKMHEVTFGYVYSGWYQVKITPHLGSNTRQSQRSKPVRLNTSYIPKGLVDLNDTISSLQYRDDKEEIKLHISNLSVEDAMGTIKLFDSVCDGTGALLKHIMFSVKQVDVGMDDCSSESRVSFLFSPDVEWHAVDRFLVTMRLVSRVDATLGSSACYASGNELSCCTFYGDKTDGQAIECTASNNGSVPNCSASNNSVQCVFRNMTPGAYCAVLSFYDDRCELDTVWTDPGNKPCQWQAYKEFEAEAAGSPSVVGSSSTLIYLVVGILFIAVVTVGALFILLRYRARTRERATHQALSPERTSRFIVEPTNNSRHFSLANQFTLTERPRPEVLLLYSRDSKPFMDLVAALKKVLDKICRCHVYDYFDEVHWNTVSVDPEGWVRELIAERDAKVVVIASRAAALRHNAPAGDVVAIRDPHPFDHLFLFALKLMRDIANDNSYRNHFVVSFDGYTDSSHQLDNLNPYTRFVLPKHLNKLFEHLHDSNTTVHFDTNRRLEEREEVRQLRLRLEHLINIKLLSKNDLGQIYDW